MVGVVMVGVVVEVRPCLLRQRGVQQRRQRIEVRLESCGLEAQHEGGAAAASAELLLGLLHQCLEALGHEHHVLLLLLFVV